MVVIEKILAKSEVNTFRQTLNSANWLDGKSTAMGMAANVKNNYQADPNDKLVVELTNILLSKMGHSPKLVSAALPHKIFPPCFNKYGKGETYGYHVDAAIMRLPDRQDVIRSDVSMTVFLSEPDEYEGGELVVATDFGEQRVKLKAGDAVVYPSSSLHQVTPVQSGERMAAICWMQSMIADSNVRKTLFDLDSTIQGCIAKEQVDREELDKLHNVYHNLIRHFTHI